MSGFEAVILDWAGTTVDCGCMAPVGVFVEVFRREGVVVTTAQAREPMGTQKREHIRRMTTQPDVREAWETVHGRAPTEVDIDRMYACAEPLQIEVLPDYAAPISGVVETISRLRARGMKVGSCTGYSRSMLDVLAEASASQGYAPDVHVAATEVRLGRPAPFMPWEVAHRLEITRADRCVVVGDTVVDVQLGRAAGMWSIGVARTGSLVGRDEASLASCEPEQLASEVAKARQMLLAAGAHLVIDDLTELPDALDVLEGRQQEGERP